MSRNEIGRKKMNHARNRWDVACAVILAGGMFLAGSASEPYGQTCPAITDPAPLNTNAATDHYSNRDESPQVVTDGVGNWVAVWQSYSDLGGPTWDYDIFFSRSTDNGTTWTDPTPLNTNADSDSHMSPDRFPRLTTDSGGNWVVVWGSRDDLGGTIGTDYDIQFARSTDSGATWTDSAPLNTNAAIDSGGDWDPQVTTDRQGNWVAVWISRDDLGGTIGDDHDILVARSTDNGATWTDPAPLDTNAASDDNGLDAWTYPQLTTDSGGNWVAVWHSWDTLGGTTGTDKDILFSRSTDNGATWTDPEALNTNATTDSGRDADPQLTTDGLGNWVAVWNSKDNLGGTIGTDDDILLARSTDNGATWTDPEPLNTNAATDSRWDRLPQLTTDGPSYWIAVWQSTDDLGGTIGNDVDILFSRSTDNGITWTDPAALITNADSDSGSDGSQQLTTDSGGNWVAVWSSTDSLGGTIGTDWDILVARFQLPAAYDCNSNGIPDEIDIAEGTSGDCQANGIPDECEEGGNADCNSNGEPDLCDLALGTSRNCNTNCIPDECEEGSNADCNGNGEPDLCDIAVGTSRDCNTNSIPDECDIADGTSDDCQANDIPDECEPDCNGNSVADSCDISGGTSRDCNENDVPDYCDIAEGTSRDCNKNGIPDECEPDLFGATISLVPVSAVAPPEQNPTPDGWSISGNEIILQEGVRKVWLELRIGDWDPLDCGVQLRSYYVSTDGSSFESGRQGRVGIALDVDCSNDSICEAVNGRGSQCNSGDPHLPRDTCVPGFVDSSRSDFVFSGIDQISGAIFDPPVDFLGYTSPGVGVDDPEPFPAEGLYAGTLVLYVTPSAQGTFTFGMESPPGSSLFDQNSQRIPLLSLVPALIHIDCNGNGIPDEQDLAAGTSDDCNGNDIPDECETGGTEDCNANGIVDLCDIEAGTSEDCDLPPHNCCDPDHGPGCNNPDIEACVCAMYPYCCDPLGWWYWYCVEVVEDWGCGQCSGGNGVPDECEPDCNDNLQPDVCDIGEGISEDCNFNGIPDECEPGGIEDCNANGSPDLCDIYVGTSEDCNRDAIPDECGLAAGTSRDCNRGGIPDECPPTAAEDVLWVGPQSCSSDSECQNGSVCRDGICYFTYNRFLRFHAPNATLPVAIRIRHVASAATKFVALPFDWPDIGSSRLLKVSRTSDVPSYLIWPTEAINVTDCFIVPGQVYEIQAIGWRCDPADEDAYSASLTLPTATFADAVGIQLPMPPEGVVNIISDALGSLEAFQAFGETTSLLHYDMEPEIPDLSINITDVMEFVRGFRSREEYRFSAPQDCP